MNHDPSTALKEERKVLRTETEQVIAFANMNMKIRYDLIRKSLDLKVDDLVFLKLHKGYTQPDLINRKFSKQRLGPVKILEKIGKLAYRLKIPSS
jgi:hypothetical protein